MKVNILENSFYRDVQASRRLVDWFNGCWLLGIKVKRYKGFLSFVFYFLYFVFCILSWRALCLLSERCEFFEITTKIFSGSDRK